MLYPTVCGFCKTIHHESICPKCKIKVQTYQENGIHNYSDSDFSRHFFVFRYEGLIRKALVEYKFKDKPYLYETFVNLLLNDKKVCGFLKSYDIIIPVPISKKRKQNRGYNQCELLAKKLAKNLPNIQLVSDALIKIRDNIPQSSLTKQERITNVKGMYQVKNKEKIQNKKIVLLDDVFTTGSTVAECSKVLKEAGAKEIGVLTLAKD